MNLSPTDYSVPDWPAPASVRAMQTTRLGGVSAAPYASLNLGDHVGDAPVTVARNRMLLNMILPSEPVWLEQVHGIAVADADRASCIPQADACIARRSGSVCVVMTADCLPVLLCDKQGSVVGAAHAGWRGLAAGVIEATVNAMGVPPQNLMAWLGPAISRQAFEVGDEVRAVFVEADPQAASAFLPSPCKGEGGGGGRKYMADIYALARQRLNAIGVAEVYGGDRCTYSEPGQFFSYRRDGVTGRQGTFIWLEKSADVCAR
ncbi:MAG: peptidoglycan editing factor PgeF [Proteobacteria bacterium]|nr:peptidoglycan editing factor PgeF [Pseudomonadota bacterium]